MITTPIDLSQLPFPGVVEVIDYETLLAERKAALIALFPVEQQADIAATLELESEPMTIHLQENAYREVVLRQRINDAARALMLAYAKGGDLDQLVAWFGVQRLVITPADPENGVAAVMESDADLRKRGQLALEGFSVAGPEGAYISHALGADADVLDVAIDAPRFSKADLDPAVSAQLPADVIVLKVDHTAGLVDPMPGMVAVTILSRDGDGNASAELLDTVSAALNADTVRPITDEVVTRSAAIVTYQVQAALFTFPGPDPAVVLDEARKRLDAYIAECHRLGREVVISAIHAALHVPGVQRVELTQPAADIAIASTQAPHCTAKTITHGGVYG